MILLFYGENKEEHAKIIEGEKPVNIEIDGIEVNILYNENGIPFEKSVINFFKSF